MNMDELKIAKGGKKYILNRLDAQYNEFIELLSSEFPRGSIGMEYVQFGRLYFDIAIDVFHRYSEEFPTEIFNEYWNEHLNAEKRIFFRGKVDVKVDYEELRKESEFNNFPFLELCDNVYVVFESCNISVFWNNGAKVDEEFARAYLKEYFENDILAGYAKGLEEFNRQKTPDESYTYRIFVSENDEYMDIKLYALSTFYSIKSETILKYFSEFTAEHNMWVKPYEYGVCGDIDVLEFIFGSND